MLSYSQKLSRSEVEEASTQEDYFTLPKILELNGLPWSSLPQNEAREIALQLVQDNQKEFGHTGDMKKHAKMDILDRYYYVISGGVVKKSKKEKEELLNKDTGDDRAIGKMVQEGALALPSLNSGASSSGVTVKEEHPGQEEVKVKLSHLKSALAALQKQAQQGPPLQKRFEFLGKKDEAMRLVGAELKEKLAIVSDFMDDALTAVVEAECSKEEEAAGLLPRLRAAVSSCEAHIAGSKEMFVRYKAMAR